MDIPASHADLLDRPLPGALTTHFANGRLQSSVVWFWRGDDGVRISTMTEFVKARNLRERPRATLLIWDVDGRWLELRADVRELPLTPQRALADCDDVAFRYCGLRPYFGAVVPAEWADTEHPVTFRLAPAVVTAGRDPALVRRGTGSPPDEPGMSGEGRKRLPSSDGAAAPDEPATLDQGLTPRSLPDEREAFHSLGGNPVAARTDAEVPLPADHLDLLTGDSVRLLATADPEGRARVRPAACRLVGGRPVVAVDDEQTRDLARDPRATLLVVDHADSARWMEVRADAMLTDAIRPGVIRTEAIQTDTSWTDASPAGRGGVVLLPRRVVLNAIHP